MPVAFILLAIVLAGAACGGNQGGDQGRIEAGRQVYLATGATGVAVGRNVWESANPLEVTEKIKKIVFGSAGKAS